MDANGMVDVLDVDGVHLLMQAASEPAAGHEGQVDLTLDDGQRVQVPAALLHKHSDGTYYLPLHINELRKLAEPAEGEDGTEQDTLVVPVIEEYLDVSKRPVSRRVLVHKTVGQHEVVIDEPTLQEEVEVERVPIGRPVDGPVAARQEGDVLIIPLLEEVLVVEKRLMLREELRITRRRNQVHELRRETVRSEQVSVERLPGGQPEHVQAQPDE